jgi:hypothetical protein
MSVRRRWVSLATASVLVAGGVASTVAVSGCSNSSQPLSATAEASSAGSVTNPTGSVSGKSLTGLQDAETIVAGSTEPIGATTAQWQMGSVLTDRTGICSRLINGMQTYQTNEITLQIVVTGWTETGSAPYTPPAADLPLTLTAESATEAVSSDGVKRLLRSHVMRATKNGRAGKNIEATGGTVTLTDVQADGSTSGSYDLDFGSDHATGSFVAPKC